MFLSIVELERKISFQEIDFNVRRAAIRFLTALLSNCTKALQEIILESGPMGVSKLIDLLQDEREVIRNDVKRHSHSPIKLVRC